MKTDQIVSILISTLAKLFIDCDKLVVPLTHYINLQKINSCDRSNGPYLPRSWRHLIKKLQSRVNTLHRNEQYWFDVSVDEFKSIKVYE